jgi:hypothetical protein
MAGAKVQNTAKKFNFRVEIDGIDQFLMQEFELPEESYDIVKHGDTNFDVKTAGRRIIGDGTFKNIISLNTSQDVIKDRMDAIGAGVLPSTYKEDMIVSQLLPDGVTAVKTWVLKGAFFFNLKVDAFSRTSSDNQIINGKISADDIILL